MNSKGQKVFCQDYDFYTITVPLKMIFKKRRNRYISSQLQKLHPCFSDDSAFDSYLYLKKDGIKADLVVMQNYKLAEYKAEKKRIIVEERKHHQFFAGRKNMLAWFVIFFLLLLFCFSIRSLHKNDYPQENIEIQKAVSPAPALQNHFASPELFNLLLELDGKIKELTWTCDGYKENLSLTLKGLYPENLADFFPELSFSSVKFQDSLPLMTVSMSHNYGQVQAGNSAELSAIKEQLRQLIFDNKIILEQESVNPYGIHLAVEQKHKNNLISILDFLQQQAICPSLIKINSNQSRLNLDFEFAQIFLQGQEELYQSIKEILRLFEVQEAGPELSGPPPKKDSPVAPVSSPVLKKIGQIIKSDGLIVIYYKDEKGKIIKR